jgi:hypothetical protein
MKIAIYGDSFGREYDGWPKYFANLVKSSSIDIFAVSSTSADFSYLRFLETHEKYDRIIFLWSSNKRSSLVSENPNTLKINHHISLSCDWTLENCFETQLLMFKNKPLRKYFPELNENLKKWTVYQHQFMNLYPHNNVLLNLAMRDSVKLKRPDSINVECFNFRKTKGITNVTLVDMMQFSKKMFGQCFFLAEDFNVRKNHLTYVQNIEFAKYMHIQFERKDFDIHKTFKNPKKYYTMSKTYEDSGFLQ